MRKIIHLVRDVVLVIPGGCRLYRWFVGVRERRRYEHDRRVLGSYGGILMQLLYDRLHGKVPYFLTYGNLLGCVREHAFLQHDDDVDLGVMPGVDPGVLLHALEGSKLKYVGGYIYQGKVTQVAYAFFGMRVDFFFYFADGEDYNAYTCIAEDGVTYAEKESGCRLYIEPAVTGLREIAFMGAQTFIPENAEAMLVAHYGPAWRHPDPDWVPVDIVGRYKSMMLPGTMRYSVSKEEVLRCN